jgi:carbonic anhydrase/acetyltransferase-like protein (isoleucine patch superfamily)
MKYSLGAHRVITHGDYWIAPGAHVIGNVILGRDVSIWFNSVVRGDNDLITIGDHSQVQDGCVLHSDPGFPILLGKGVSIGHKSMIHGCTIGDGTLIGINSVVLNGAKIGKNCVIGANSLITEKKVIPDGVMVMGSPGKVVRELRPEEIAFFNSVADNYAERAKRYKVELKIDDTP